MRHILGVILLLVVGSAQAAFVTVDFSASHNSQVYPTFPTGPNTTLGGVEFDIPTTAPNMWASGGDTCAPTGFGCSGTYVLDMSVGAYGATEAYTLINTYWGVTSGGRTLVEFFGSDGAYYQKDLIGNVDVRDWALNYTSAINNTSTVNVASDTSCSPHDCVMDMQTYLLPTDFHDEVLTNIRITDNRTGGQHSAFVSGVTVNAVPIPAAVWLFGSGLGILGWVRRRKTV